MSDTSKNFQVIERAVLSEDEEGRMSNRASIVTELLLEGEIIEKDGLRFQVVKNQLGTLYKKSISPLGQVGFGTPMTPLEFQKMTELAANEKIERLKRPEAQQIADLMEYLVANEPVDKSPTQLSGLEFAVESKKETMHSRTVNFVIFRSEAIIGLIEVPVSKEEFDSVSVGQKLNWTNPFSIPV